jgi:hypothetical protein
LIFTELLDSRYPQESEEGRAWRSSLLYLGVILVMRNCSLVIETHIQEEHESEQYKVMA